MKINLDKIRGLIAENKDTQAGLAEKLGVSKTTVNYMLTGVVRMTLETATQIAKIYGVAPLDLITEEQ